MRARVDIRNNMAVAGWVFMSIWTGGVGLMTYAYVRDGGFHQFNPLLEVGIVLMFWTFGIAGCAHLFAIPRVRVTIAQNEVTVSERWLLRRRSEVFPATALAARLVPGRDDEGDPYFRCEVTAPSGNKVVISESHDELAVAAVLKQLKAAAE